MPSPYADRYESLVFHRGRPAGVSRVPSPTNDRPVEPERARASLPRADHRKLLALRRRRLPFAVVPPAHGGAVEPQGAGMRCKGERPASAADRSKPLALGRRRLPFAVVPPAHGAPVGPQGAGVLGSSAIIANRSPSGGDACPALSLPQHTAEPSGLSAQTCAPPTLSVVALSTGATGASGVGVRVGVAATGLGGVGARVGVAATGLGGVGARVAFASVGAGVAVGFAAGSAIVEVGDGAGDGSPGAASGVEGTLVGVGPESQAAAKSKSEARMGTVARNIGESVALAEARMGRRRPGALNGPR